ncbi:AAA family ATPase [Peptoniphilus equinus]|uniref:AAA family ATPase n=1 Tax=Peptoniphilus equinus TaxID=3016343 RepID=A0ABY7QTL9_9FIRM|nr:AAA family ATPase [Peptoniphilus equinus]WBW50134.1 AAA family ATPase [Peptoniphilus equinus]
MIFVLAGPSGSGKTTQAERLSQRDDFKRIITCTTRPMRQGESHGVDYFFLDKDQFQTLQDAGELLAVTTYSNNHYGVPKQNLLPFIDSTDEHLVMVLDLEGVKVLTNMGAVCIRLTLDRDTLKQRMEERGDETANIEARLNDGKGIAPYASFTVDSRDPIDANAEKISKYVDACVHKKKEQRSLSL